MHWDALRRLGRPVLVSMVMLFLGSTRAAGDISPAGCNGNGIQLSISRNPANGVNGQAITYKFSIANLDDPASGTVACDVTGVTVNFYCPGADGTPNLSNPINLATGLNLPAPTAAMALPSQTCTLNVNPGVTVATASIVAGQQTGNPNHACTLSNPCTQGTLHDSATNDAFQSNKTVSVGVLTCTVQIDKQISCGNAACTSDADCVTQTGDANAKCLSANTGQRCFVDVGFESNGEGGVHSCLGWNAFTVDGTSMPAEPVIVRYIANNTGGTTLFSCTVTDTNTVLSSTEVTLGDVVTVSTPAEIDQTCSAELSASEPDTATVSCFCTADKNPNLLATATDTAKFQCLTPGLNVTKTCLVQDANGNNEVDVTLMNTSTDTDLANCVVTDNVFPDSATCPPTSTTSTPVTIPGVASLTHGMSTTVKGVVSGLTKTACNTASVTCDIVGSVDPANPPQPKKLAATDSNICEVVPVCPTNCANPRIGGGSQPPICTVLELDGGSVSITGPAGGIDGDICIADGGKLAITGSQFVTGNIRLSSGATHSKSGSGTTGQVQNNQNLSLQVTDALNRAALDAALPCTQTIETLSGGETIVGNGGLNVICVGKVTIGGKVVTLMGGTSDQFVINVTGKFALTGGGQIRVAGGVQPGAVEYNIIGTGEQVAFSGGGGGTGCCKAIVDGTLLAPDRNIALSPGLVNGQVISGRNISIVSGASVRCKCPTT